MKEAQKIAKVRALLTEMDDSPNSKSENSLASLATEYGVTFQALKKFRDGNDRAIPKSTVSVWSQLIGLDTGPYPGDYKSPVDFYNEIYGRQSDRSAKFDQYEIMRKTRGEVDSAASVWADMVCTGAISEDNRYSGGFLARVVDEKQTKEAGKLREIGGMVNNYVVPTTTLHTIVRDMVINGSQYEQLGFGLRKGKPHITKLIPMPIRHTRVIDINSPDRMYGFFKLQSNTEPEKVFESWRMAHFANYLSRIDEEGTSVFASSLRVWVQVESMEGGMITRRLERAPMRFKWVIDTTGCKDAESRRNEVEKYKNLYKKQRTVDAQGKFQMLKISPPAGEDLYVGKSNKDSPADVSALDGDAHLAEIADFDHFFNRFLAGLGPPKHHLGYEADTMRSVGTDLTIVFARKARRLQMQVAKTLNHFYWIELLLQGIDPRDYDYLIIPPTLGTRDELVRAQVMMAHATVCKYLTDSFSTTGKVPDPGWFLRYVMGMDDVAIEQMNLKPVLGKAATASSKPSTPLSPTEAEAMREHLNKDEEIKSELKWTRYILEERMLREAPASYLMENNYMSLGDFFPSIDCDHFMQVIRDAGGIENLRFQDNSIKLSR